MSLQKPGVVNDCISFLQPPQGVITDPEVAAYEMFGKDELERGIQYDEEIKQAAMAKYEV